MMLINELLRFNHNDDESTDDGILAKSSNRASNIEIEMLTFLLNCTFSIYFFFCCFNRIRTLYTALVKSFMLSIINLLNRISLSLSIIHLVFSLNFFRILFSNEKPSRKMKFSFSLLIHTKTLTCDTFYAQKKQKKKLFSFSK